MDRKKIKKLAEASYNENSLDEGKVNRIVINFKRAELRDYIKALKEIRKKKTVYVDSSFELGEEYKKEIGKSFPNRVVIFRNNPQLVLGIRITENDIVYNLNLQNSLNQIQTYLEKYL